MIYSGPYAARGYRAAAVPDTCQSTARPHGLAASVGQTLDKTLCLGGRKAER
jgi:hypothetical protein